MRLSFLWMVSVCLLLVSAGCHDSHFLTDASYRERVEQDFRQKQSLLTRGDLFAIFRTDLSDYEREALEFLYAYMPLADIVNYPGEFHLMNVQAARRAKAEMPWGEQIPEDVFRHFVLPVRVNNEYLDSSRVVFYDELKERVRSLSLQNAILEVNHWCHEKVVYQPSDARTSSPLATVRTAFGRCGEESTLLVAALRSVGIPARQVYTPRWAHTDDNHAWVEAWADGRWWFLGACEPEPVLNLGWFNAPASRGMLMHTKVFGRYEGAEEVMDVTPNHTEINVTDNYAPTARAIVQVQDKEGNKVSGARVEFKLYNYAEFYTVATKQTGEDGTCSLTAGRGDMLVWAAKDNHFGFAKLTFGAQSPLIVTLDKQEGDLFSVDMDIVPPAETAVLPEVTPEQRAENSRRMAEEDSIRNAYTATFLTQEQATAFVQTLSGLAPEQAEYIATILKASRGNHATLCEFLKRADEAGETEHAGQLLSFLSEKDWRDVRMEVLTDHLQHTPEVWSIKSLQNVLRPRISTEELTPYKSFFQSVIDVDLAAHYQKNPDEWIAWCRDSLTILDSLNVPNIPMSPEGVWKSRVADRHSRDIFFVAVARSFGVPAWIDMVTGKVCYMKPTDFFENKADVTYTVDFDGEEDGKMIQTGQLAAVYHPTKLLDDPKYYTHFTLSRYEDGRLRLQEYDDGQTWSSLLKHRQEMPVGYYVMVTGTRLANGGVLAHLHSFNVKESSYTETTLPMRENSDEVQVIGSFNSESLFLPVTPDGTAPAKQSLLQACGRGYFVVGILGVNQEPTNHALRDLAALGQELEQWGRRMVLLFPDGEARAKFQADDFAGLPETVIYGIDTDGICSQIVENMKLRNAGSLPIFIIADTFNRVVFVSQGYTIGLGEQLMKTVSRL